MKRSRASTKRVQAILRTMFGPFYELRSGCIAVHDDGRARHVAIVLQVRPEMTKALFFTSSPKWAPGSSHGMSRRAKRAEVETAGFVSSRPTYLTLVERPTVQFNAQTGPSFSSDVIGRLLTEFEPR